MIPTSQSTFLDFSKVLVVRLRLSPSVAGHLWLGNERVAAIAVNNTGARSQVLKVDLLVALVGLVGGNSIVTVLPTDNLVTPVSNLVAECLHGKNGKGFLHLCGQFFDTEKEKRNHGSGRNHTNVVPGGIKGLVQSQWHKEQPERQETSRVSVVNQWDGGCQKTFAGTQVILKDSEGLVHLVLSHKVHWKVLDGHGKIKKSTVRSVGSVDDGVCLALGQSLVEFQSEGGFVFPFRRQVTLHGANKGPSADRKSLKVGFTFFGRNLGGIVESISHTNKITGVVAAMIDDMKKDKMCEKTKVGTMTKFTAQ